MKRALSLIFAVMVFTAFLTPMELGDIWWHLRTGQWLWQERALPDADPFSLGGGGGGQFVLRGFWLFELLVYGLWRLAGLYGLIALKAGVFTACFVLLGRLLRRYGLEPPIAYLVLLPTVFIASFYDEIRPQTFTFFFFTATLYLLERRKAEPGFQPFWGLPLLMLLWSNIHAGFVSGLGLIAFYLLAGLIRGERKAGFYLISLASFGAASLNPNGLKAVSLTLGMFTGSLSGGAPIHEHLSAVEFAAFTGEGGQEAAIIALTVAGALSFLLRVKRPDVYHLILFPAFSFAAFTTFRAGLFFALIAGMVVGKNISGLKIPGKATLWGTPASALAFILIGVFLLPETVVKRPVVNERLIPVKIADFIESKKPPGNIFHPYEWGGYLMWRLYPQYKVFIDGRALGLTKEYDEVAGAGASWREALDRHKVNTVVFWPLMPYKSRAPGIVLALMNDRGWSPVYWDLQGVAFVRAPLAENPIKKEALWELLQSLIAAGLMESPSAEGYTSLGIIQLERGMRQDAIAAFQNALALDPKNEEAGFWLRTLR